MNFVSISFLVFSLITLFLYYVIPYKFRFVLLLIASYVFYGLWNWSMLSLMIAITLVSYTYGIVQLKSNNDKVKTAMFVLSIIVSIGILFFFKYFNFLISTINNVILLFKAEQEVSLLDIILPVGISFYTFQALSYVIDVRKNKIEPETHLGYYALFVSFFPQLVAGPIERPEHLIPQLKSNIKFDLKNLYEGFVKCLIGYFKKVFIADSIARCVNIVFNNVVDSNGLAVVIGSVLFAIQIYCDFSGYTDIAIGVSKMFGIDLVENFKNPYAAVSIKDFWSRWHISLTQWFRDYIYIPLGGNRVSKLRHLLNIVIVFAISGLWHGAAWTFIFWGLIHGVYQVIAILSRPLRNRIEKRLKINTSSSFYKNICQFVTFCLVVFAWIFFRANSISDLGIILKSLFTNWSFSASFVKDTLIYLDIDMLDIILFALSIVILNKVTQQDTFAIKSNCLYREQSMATNIYALGIIVYLVVIMIMILQSQSALGSFIYFQF